ncbi:MAG TPA: cytochrome c-type biogenesis protein [Acidimicrobiia bacterium]|nr:cytochrome c-type biogenesis protein [Acidimicrobiia bacterium]
MSERARSLVAIAVSLAAITVVVVGIMSSPAAEQTAAERVDALSALIKCPFCNGESLAESGSGVAADYRALIAERVDDGYSDREILDEFAERFGPSFVLDGSTNRWSFLLWLAPLAILVAGAAAILSMRSSAARREVNTP